MLLVNGHVLKVDGFELAGDRVRFDLPSGGRLELSLLRIERIVDDEIEAEEVPLAIGELRLASGSDSTTATRFRKHRLVTSSTPRHSGTS